MQQFEIIPERWQNIFLQKKILFLEWASKYGKLLGLFGGFILTSVLFYHYTENWSILDCIYFITVTLLTVGYGDVVPTNDGTRLFTVFMIIFGLIFILKILNDSASSIVTYLLSNLVRLIFVNNTNVSLAVILETKLRIVFAFVTFSVVFGIVFISVSTGSSFITSLYWTVQTISTVGFGDIRLETRTERILNTFYLLAGLCVFSAALCVYNEIGDEIEKVRRQEQLLGRAVDLEQLTFLTDCERTNRPVTKFDFVIEMLLHTGKINRERDLQPLLEKFAENKNVEGEGDDASERSVRDVRHLISKYIDETAVRRNELENDRLVLVKIQSSLPFKYVTMIIGSVSSFLSKLNSVRAAAERSFSTHGLAIPTHSPRKQSPTGQSSGAASAQSDVQDRMERGSDSSEGAGGVNALDDVDSVSDDGRRLI